MDSLSSSKPHGLEKWEPYIHYILHNRSDPELEHKKGKDAGREPLNGAKLSMYPKYLTPSSRQRASFPPNVVTSCCGD